MTAQSRPSIGPRRRILISGGLAVGGPQTHLTILCQVLLQAGAEITIASASTNWTPDAIARIRAMGVRVVVSPFGFGAFRLLGKVWSFVAWPFLLRRHFDVLYCVGEGRMHLWAAQFISRGGWKIYHELVECPQRDSVSAQVLRQMDAVIANSRQVGEDFGALVPEIPVRSVPCFASSGPIDLPLPRQAVANGTLRIAFLGRLVPHKRPVQLIASWPAWNSTRPMAPTRLDIYGGDYDGEGSRLRSKITELHLQDHVHVQGEYRTSDLPRILAETDIVVLPSLYEGLPVVLVEAMQRGIPVVATSAGGTAELGEDNPDVIISEGTDWPDFEQGLMAMATRVRSGAIDSVRLHQWTEKRYGFPGLSTMWQEVLFTPDVFFAPPFKPSPTHLCAP